MSFAFGFTEEDFSDDELDHSKFPKTTNSENIPRNNSKTPALDKLSSYIEDKHLPQIHSFSELLSSLKDVRITFDNYYTPRGKNLVYRRELFDVKHQIMTEDKSEIDSDANTILIDENSSDLQKNVYEGGFKSWECSYDVIDKLSESINVENSDDSLLNKFNSFLDLGCGTSLPSCYLFLQILQQKSTNKKIILADFNYDVLRLVSLPNLLIHWASTLPVEKLYELTTSEENPTFNNDEILITDRLINEFTHDLQTRDIELVFISGSWSKQFNSKIEYLKVDYIISSETIYSLDSLPIVAECLIEILESTGNGQALIAAKNIYFGVGGSIIEFLRYFDEIKGKLFTSKIEEINESQLRRSIVTITKI
ncbi:uncharacterized protein RJT21DRAFT_79785 [Scheffersomyces amazonensis]|uniref:uncharacterized protein n=1 Tax=Scheffersomyces amazonensis TaxID=1078765 RepID=UPI00315D8B80